MSRKTALLLSASLLLALCTAALPARGVSPADALRNAPSLDRRLDDLDRQVDRVDASIARAIARGLSPPTGTEPARATRPIPDTVTTSLVRELDAIERQLTATAPERSQVLAPRLQALRTKLERLEVQRTNLGKLERERRIRSAPRTGDAPDGSGGAISGRVTDAVSGVPLAGVTVLVWSSDLSSLWGTSTGAAGNYSIGSLDPGTYFVHTDDAGFYRDELHDNLPCLYGGCNRSAGDPVVVTAGATTSGIDFALDRIGGITGLVTEEASGDPVLSGFINVWDGDGFFVEGGSIDFTGAYAIGAEPGTYFVTISPFSDDYQGELYDDLYCFGGFACDVTTGDGVQVVGTGVTFGIDFVLEAAGVISGTVTEAATGDPLADAPVQIWDSVGSFLTTGFTDSGGEYTIGGFASGTHFATTGNHGLFGGELYDNLPCTSGDCDPTTGTPIAVVAGATSTGIDFALSEQSGITGTVTMEGSGDPILFIGLDVYGGNGSFVDGAGSDENGDYVILLAPGTYHVVTRTFGAYLDELYDDIPCPQGFFCTFTSGAPIVVAATPTTDVDFELLPAGLVSGQVTDAASADPLVNTFVTLYDATESPVGFDSTNGNGDFSISGLAAGTHFAFALAGTFHRPELWDDIPCPYGNCNVLDGTPIAVTTGTTTPGVDFELTQLGGITGAVSYTPPASPLPFALIDIYDSGGSYVTSSGTDFGGGYAQGLESGTYFALAHDFSGYRPELYQDIPCPGFLCDPTTGTPIVVTGTTVVPGIDFELDFELFSDGFESGDLSAWSVVVP